MIVVKDPYTLVPPPLLLVEFQIHILSVHYFQITEKKLFFSY